MTSCDDDFLTTDACPPSVPQEEKKTFETVENLEEINANSSSKENRENVVYEQVEAKRKSKSKTKKINNQAYANVINISGSKNIHIGSNITINNSATKSHKNNVIKTNAIETILSSTYPASNKDIMFVSANIGEGWRNLFRMLDYTEAQIDQFYESHIQKGIKEVIYQILLDWIQNEADDATIGKLSNALWNSDHKEVVQQLSLK